MGVVERLDQVAAGVQSAALAAGRDPTSVTLVAVSKTHAIEAVQQAQGAGHAHFGESRGQELRAKAQVEPTLRWHFVGRIQTNKAKFIAPHAFRVHSLESLRQAEALAKRAPHPLKCLVSVNVGREEQKGGVLPEDALALCRQISQSGVVQLTGLMCIPPNHPDPLASAPFYEELAHIAAKGRADGLDLRELSMGMSRDYAVAIANGATWVRVGTAIFGQR